MRIESLPEEYQMLDFAMTDFQIKHFVVNSQHSTFRQFKQILLEMEVRMTNIESIKLEMKKNVAERKLLDEKISKEESIAQKEIYEIEKEKLYIAYENNERAILRSQYELDCLEKLYNQYKSQYDVKSLLENKDEEEKKYWIKRLASQASLELLTSGRVGQGNLEAMLQMGPDNFKLALIEATKLTNEVKKEVKFIDMMSEDDINKIGNKKYKEIE